MEALPQAPCQEGTGDRTDEVDEIVVEPAPAAHEGERRAIWSVGALGQTRRTVIEALHRSAQEAVTQAAENADEGDDEHKLPRQRPVHPCEHDGCRCGCRKRCHCARDADCARRPFGGRFERGNEARGAAEEDAEFCGPGIGGHSGHRCCKKKIDGVDVFWPEGDGTADECRKTAIGHGLPDITARAFFEHGLLETGLLVFFES